MGCGVSLLIAAIGAVLLWAGNTTVAGVSLDVIGVILIVVGVVGLILSLLALVSRRESGDQGDMTLRLAGLLSAAALVLVACGDEEQAPQGQEPPGGGQPRAEQTEPPAEPAVEPRTAEEFVRESVTVAETVAGAARRLAEDSQADVSDELARAEERARSLEKQAELPAQEGREFGEQAVRDLDPRARLGLLRLNARTEAAARRLRGAVDVSTVKEEQIRQIARQEFGRVRGELDTLRDAVPPDLRDGVDALRGRLGELAS